MPTGATRFHIGERPIAGHELAELRAFPAYEREHAGPRGIFALVLDFQPFAGGRCRFDYVS